MITEREVIEQTYPAYRITRTRDGWWFATRLRAVSPEDRALGIIASIGRPDAISLGVALSAQHGLLMLVGRG